MSRKSKVLIGAGILTLLLGGVAVALSPATGGGTARARSLSAVAITVTAIDGAPDLYPGFSGGDLHFNATNTNPYDVTFTDFAVVSLTSSDVDCDPALWIDIDDVTPISVAVAAGATNVPKVIADVVTMDALAPVDCEGVSFDVSLTLTGDQV